VQIQTLIAGLTLIAKPFKSEMLKARTEIISILSVELELSISIILLATLALIKIGAMLMKTTKLIVTVGVAVHVEGRVPSTPMLRLMVDG